MPSVSVSLYIISVRDINLYKSCSQKFLHQDKFYRKRTMCSLALMVLRQHIFSFLMPK